jgi:hypothetical protein
VDDLDARIAKITYRDLDGNEFGFGGAGAREP